MSKSEEIVISGIAGRYPTCNNVAEFQSALLNGVDMVTEDSKRFQPGLFGTPRKTGKIDNIEYFDADFFGVTSKQANVMDPRHRVTIETVFEAIVDSGYNPKELRGSRTGVYVGLGYLDTQKHSEDDENTFGYKLVGSSLALIANRTSFCFDFRGPSYAMDTACSSSLYALATAVKAIENGDIDNAMVSAVTVIFNPYDTKEYVLLKLLAKDGNCKVFSKNRDGFVRSEAVVTLFLQRKSLCRRHYATVLGAGMNCDGFKAEGINVPSGQSQSDLIKTLYESKHLNVNDVSYVEIHGTGTLIGDHIECKSISEMFCSDRKDPLLVGSVKSNMGHGEMSAGLCGVSKVIIAMETGTIPANLHCDNIDMTLPGLDTGKLKVVTKNTKWNGGIVSLNSFGFGGANAHIILKSNPRQNVKSNLDVHRLVTVSGRTYDAVQHYINGVKTISSDAEALALIDAIHKFNIDGHTYRGYVTLGDDPTMDIQRVESKQRPIWFIYSGMGSQWTGMARDFMKIDVFKQTFTKCHDALKPYHLDLFKIISSDDPTTLEDVTNCFSVITAVQIALTDVLKSIGIEADGFAGHSLGETCCAYYSGGLTVEQTVLLGFARGYSTVQAKLPQNGQMVAVGLSYQECIKILPKDLFVSCINNSYTVTVSGIRESVLEFVSVLKKKNVFTKLVNTGGYAFHSKLSGKAADILRDFACKVIPDPKPRSPKWISSSWPENKWDDQHCRMNSADYTAYNFENMVRFDQVLKRIPKNAIVIEVSPHGLLTPLIKRELGSSVTCLTLGNRNVKNNLKHFLENIGKFYLSGGQPNLTKLYNSVSFPVGRGTANIGSLIKWDHSVKWYTPFFNHKTEFGKKITVNTSTEKFQYLLDYELNGQVLMPFAGYLEMVWKVLADLKLKAINDMPILFESVSLRSNTILPEDQDVHFYVNIMKHSGYFEIFNGEVICCQGKASIPENINDEFSVKHQEHVVGSDNKLLTMNEIYKILNLKELRLRNQFRCLKNMNLNGDVGVVIWNGNYTTFLSNLLQVPAVSSMDDTLLMPLNIQKIVIDPTTFTDGEDIIFHRNTQENEIRCTGVEISNITFSNIHKKTIKQDSLILQEQVFVPYEHHLNTDEVSNVSMAIQIIFENSGITKNLRSRLQFKNASESEKISNVIGNILKSEYYKTMEFIDEQTASVEVIISNQLDISMKKSLINDGFLLIIGEKPSILDGFQLIYSGGTEDTISGVYLLRHVTQPNSFEIIDINNHNLEWIDKIKEAIKQDIEVVYLTNSSDDLCGIMGLVRCLNFEPYENTAFKCFIMDETNSAPFSLSSVFYRNQAAKKLAFNVLKNGVWGSYRYVPAKELKENDVYHASYEQGIEDGIYRWYEHSTNYSHDGWSSEYVYVFYSSLGLNTTPISRRVSSLSMEENKALCEYDYSGVTQNGSRVMGIGLGQMSLQIASDSLLTWNIPNKWTLEEAATVPLSYYLTYYALITKAQIKPQQTVLVLPGSDNISLAAISICFGMNCEVYTIADSNEARAFMLRRFPKLKSTHIGNSLNNVFINSIKIGTNGKGVDIVVGIPPKNAIEKIIHCLAKHGHFAQILNNNCFDTENIYGHILEKSIVVHLIKLSNILECENSKKHIYDLLNDGISKGIVHPLPTKIYTDLDIDKARDDLSSTYENILIKLRDETPTTIKNPTRSIKASPRLYFCANGVYIIVGGLGGFGLALTDFMISRGARKIILNSRRGLSNSYQTYCFKKWSMIDGLTVKISTEDSSTLEGALKLVQFSESLGNIKGIFNAALVLVDGTFVNQTADNFKSVLAPKIYSTNNMDKVTRKRCPNLEYFVAFSSVIGGKGNAGQSNYGMGNSAIERLCERRRKDGLPALAIQFGLVKDVGAVADSENTDKTLTVAGLTHQSIDSCLNSLEQFILQELTIATSYVIKKQTSASSNSGKKAPIEIVSSILGITDIAVVDTSRPLSQMGLDSIMALEIKQTLSRFYNIEIDVESIKYLTFENISDFSI